MVFVVKTVDFLYIYFVYEGKQDESLVVCLHTFFMF